MSWRRVVLYFLREQFIPRIQVFAGFRNYILEAGLLMLDHINLVRCHPICDGIALTQGVGRCIKAIVCIWSRRCIEIGFDNRNAKRLGKQPIIGVLDDGRDVRIVPGSYDHPLKRLCLIEVVLQVSLRTPGIRCVGGPVFPNDGIGRVYQIRRHKRGYITDALHISANKKDAGNAGDIVEGAGYVIIDERGPAVQADQVAIRNATVIGTIGIIGHCIFNSLGVTDIEHGGLKLVISGLVCNAESLFLIDWSNQYHTAKGLPDDVGQAKTL